MRGRRKRVREEDVGRCGGTSRLVGAKKEECCGPRRKGSVCEESEGERSVPDA